MNVKKYLKAAAKLSRMKLDSRQFWLGAVAVRKDDVMVFAYNGAPKFPDHRHHCEARLVRKLDKGATVFLARTTADGQWANSKPCPDCERALRRVQVKMIYYTTGPNQWDSMVF